MPEQTAIRWMAIFGVTAALSVWGCADADRGASDVVAGAAAEAGAVPPTDKAVGDADVPDAVGGVIVRLKGRDGIVVVRRGASGPTWSLETAEGEALVPAQSLDQLRTAHPELHRRFDTMWARRK